jgi:hypothetical protein
VTYQILSNASEDFPSKLESTLAKRHVIKMFQYQGVSEKWPETAPYYSRYGLQDSVQYLDFNGDVEKMRTDKMHSMIKDAGIPIRRHKSSPLHQDRFPSSNKSTPHETWFGSKPEVSRLPIHGFTTFSHVPKEKRKTIGDLCDWIWVRSHVQSVNKKAHGYKKSQARRKLRVIL